MKRSLMFLVVAGSWVLWANTANAEITMKLSDLCGIPTLATINAEGEAGFGVHYWQVEVASDGYTSIDPISDLSEDGTFTTEVPEGTELLAATTGCKSGLVKKWKTVNQTVDYVCDVEGGPLDIGPTSPWTPAKDGGVLIVYCESEKRK